MQKLKMILQSKYFYLSLILITVFYVYYKSVNIPKSKYEKEESSIIGIVNTIKIDGNQLSMEINAKEKIMVTYYIKSEKELENIKNQYNIGDKLKLIGVFEQPSENTVFNLFNYRKYLQSKKIYWIFKAESIIKLDYKIPIRYKLKKVIIKKIENYKNISNYLKTFILGDTSLIDSDVKSSYQANGISHLFAISGMHITLFSSFLLFILNKIFKNKLINYITVVLFLIVYAFLANFSPSIIRATLLFIFCTLNKNLKLNIKNIYLLILIGCLLLLYNPYYIYNLGFLFSFVVTFYLIIFSDLINKRKNYITKLLMTSLISFLAGLPIMINNFFNINLLSIIFNLFFVSFVSIIIFPLSMITFIVPLFEPILTFLIFILEKVSLFCSSIKFFNITLCHINVFMIIVYYFLVTMTLYFFIKERYYMIIFLIVVIFIHHNILNFNNKLFVTMIDVGQGDCILIVFPHNKGNVLIDTGGIVGKKEEWQKKKNEYSLAKEKIIPYLKSVGVKKINFLILSHGDFDHMGEAISLVNNFKVDSVIFNNDDFNELEKTLIKVLQEKNIKYYKEINKLYIGNNKLYFLNTNIYDNENDNSNVIYFELNTYKFLFMGDAGIKRENDILNKYNLKDIDFFKAGHHGSNTSSSESFINTIKPKSCLISVGEKNKYGHPKKSVLDILDDYCDIYRTDLNGSVEIKLYKNKYKIKTVN